MLICFLKMCRLGECTGISFVDSTKLCVCDNKRIPRHKVFAGIAQRDKSGNLLKEVMGKLFADKGYVSESLF